jgi:hypothetical protein
MTKSTRSKFVHRHHQDGTHESICTECVSMVAWAENAGELSSCESIHVCDRVNLQRVRNGEFLPSPRFTPKTGQIPAASTMTACIGNQDCYLLETYGGCRSEVWAEAYGFRLNSSSESGSR